MAKLDREGKAHTARRAARRRTALESAPGEYLVNQLWEMISELQDVEECLYDDDSILDVFDGSEAHVQEFIMLFASLQNDAEQVANAISGWEFNVEKYDLCMVSLVGASTRIIDYDEVETDYSFLNGYLAGYEQDRARETLMRMTKKEMLDTVGHSLRVFLAFYDVQRRYEALSDTLEILKGESIAIRSAIKEINELYNEVTDKYPSQKAEWKFDQLVAQLPDRVWIE